MIAGSLTAGILLVLIGLLTEARVQSIRAAREVTAQELVMQGIDEARLRGYLGSSAAPQAVVADLHGEYLREIIVSGGTETLFPPDNTNYKDVTVRVTFGGVGSTRVTEATVRLYE